MEKRTYRKEFKKYCTDYLYARFLEAKDRYLRITQCHCEGIGGEDCTCGAANGQTIGFYENGDIDGMPRQKSEQGKRARRGLLKHQETWNTQSLDEEDKAAIAKIAGLTRISTRSPSPLPTALPALEHHKLIRRPSYNGQVYDGMKNPLVLIINNVNFLLNPAPRCGATADMKNLYRFLDKAGFNDRKEHFDLNKQEIIDVMEGVRHNPNLVERDGFICIIMSHGGKEGIQGSDLKFIEVENITRRFHGHCCPQLATKPKLFFIQACRGNEADKGYIVPRGCGNGENVEADNDDNELPVKLPSDADFLIAYSSTKGNASFRRFTADRAYMAANVQTMGSWFISCLVDVFLAYSNREDVMTMLTRVNQAMSELYSEAGNKQMACQLSMLTKKLYFAKMVERCNRMENDGE